MKTVGETLQKEREARGLSLEEVSTYTKIGVSYLKSLEKSDYKAFSSIVNAKGFLNIYAKFLDIDKNVIDALYRREQTMKEEKVLSSYKRKKIRSSRFIFSPSYIIGLLMIVISFIVVYYLYRQYEIYAQPPRLDITSPSDKVVETSNDSISIVGKTDIGNNILIDGQQIPMLDPLGNFNIPVELHNGINTITVASENSLGKMNTKSFQVTYDSSSMTPSPLPTSGSSKSLSISLSIKDKSAWIDLIVDGKTVLDGVMSPDTNKTFVGKTSVDIKTGRADTTVLVINNQNISLSGSGVVEKTITTDQSGNLQISPQ